MGPRHIVPRRAASHLRQVRTLRSDDDLRLSKSSWLPDLRSRLLSKLPHSTFFSKIDETFETPEPSSFLAPGFFYVRTITRAGRASTAKPVFAVNCDDFTTVDRHDEFL